MLRFVITGTGRCGTNYTADLFTAAGLRCGHEEVFTAYAGFGEPWTAEQSGLVELMKNPVRRARVELRRRRTELHGDSSWMAVPRLPGFTGVSFLQLRHPLDVVRSFTGTRFFTREPTRQNRFADHYFTPVGNDVVDAMRWWVAWNDRAAEHATCVYPMEALNEDSFAGMLRRVGGDPARAGQAIRAVPVGINSGTQRGERPLDLSWDDLPGGQPKKQLAAAAQRYGYDISDRTSLDLSAPALRLP